MEPGVQLPDKHANVMAHLASALNDRPDLDWIYRTACEGLAGILSVASTFIAQYDHSAEAYLLVWAHINGATQSLQRFPPFCAPPYSGTFLRANVPVVIHAGQFQPFLKGLVLAPTEIPQVVLLASLNHEDNRLGIFGACSTQAGRDFSPEEIVRTQAIADQVAAAIVHARLYQAARKQAVYLELTNEITRIALVQGDLRVMLDRLAQRVVQTLHADGCYISLWDHGRKQMSPFSANGSHADGFMHQKNPPEAGDQTAPPVRENTIETIARFSLHERQAVITLPLTIGKRPLGHIRVEYTHPHSFLSSEDLPRWEEIASQITLAITNIQAIEQEKKRRQEAELLQQATLAITSSLDLQEVLNQILTSLEQVVPFNSSSICLIEDNSLRIAALGGSAWHARQVGERIDKSAGLFSLLETASAPVYLADAQQHPSYEHWNQAGSMNVHGWMGVPLIAGDRTTGYLLLNSRERDIYTEEHARLAQAFASQAAAAIEKARLFEQVRNGRERLQALSKKLVEIQEAERRYIAHELHDEIGQQLTGLQFMLEMGKSGGKTGRLGALSEAQQLVSGLMSQIRELSRNLHPSMIDDLGLLPTLNAHFERFQQNTGIQVHFSPQGLEGRFPAEVEVSAFRVVQESLTNVARYAGVKELQVKISADANMLNIEVSDQGQGFDTQILQDSNRSFGITGMRERTELAGGRFELASSPGEGTRITAIFPTREKLERRKNDRKTAPGG
jgi:signal transduction histidine kinase